MKTLLPFYARALNLVFFFALSLAHAHAAAGDLLVPDFGNGIIYRITPDGVRTVYTTGLNGPEGVTYDSAGNFFVSAALGNVIHRFTTGGGDSTFATGLNGPASLAFDINGNLFDAEFFGGVIYRFTPDGTRTTFATGLNGPANLAFDAAGDLFVADFNSGNVYRFAPNGTRSTFASNTSRPHGLAFDAGGNLFVADFQGGTILRFTPSGTRSTFASGLNGPHGHVFDSAGNLFVADYNSGNIYRFAPDGMRTTFASGMINPANVIFEPARASREVLANLSTRAFIGTGSGVLIGGFILQGTTPTTLILRAIGPSLTARGVPGALLDPELVVFNNAAQVVGTNSNWSTSADAAAIQRTGLAPDDTREAAVLLSLAPGSYTVVVSGTNETTGVGLVELYDLQQVTGRAGNMSTRGTVLSGNNVLIAGCIIGGAQAKEVIVRAIGPSLANRGVTDALADPRLELFNANGDVIGENDDWQQSANAATIQGRGLAPESPLESAVLITLPPGSYTAIESPAPGTSGIGLVEVYDQTPAP